RAKKQSKTSLLFTTFALRRRQRTRQSTPREAGPRERRRDPHSLRRAAGRCRLTPQRPCDLPVAVVVRPSPGLGARPTPVFTPKPDRLYRSGRTRAAIVAACPRSSTVPSR